MAKKTTIEWTSIKENGFPKKTGRYFVVAERRFNGNPCEEIDILMYFPSLLMPDGTRETGFFEYDNHSYKKVDKNFTYFAKV